MKDSRFSPDDEDGRNLAAPATSPDNKSEDVYPRKQPVVNPANEDETVKFDVPLTPKEMSAYETQDFYPPLTDKPVNFPEAEVPSEADKKLTPDSPPELTEPISLQAFAPPMADKRGSFAMNDEWYSKFRSSKWGIPAAAAIGLMIGLVVALAVVVSSTSLKQDLGAARAEINSQKMTISDLEKQVGDTESMGIDIKELENEVAELTVANEELSKRGEAVEKRAAELDAQEASLADREAAVGTAENQAAANSFGGGTFLVGIDIQPGQYRNSGTGDCYWERLSGTGGTFEEIITNAFTEGSSIVTIASTDKAFSSQFCGTWTLVE